MINNFRGTVCGLWVPNAIVGLVTMDHELLKDVSKIQGQSVRGRQTPVSGREKKINSPIHRNDGTSVTANLSRGNS